jgi:glyoxylase-like metal-dependent hydrolase (beta-lactamase superfamily II)
MIHEFMIGNWCAVVLQDGVGAATGAAARLITSWPLERVERELAALGTPALELTIGYNCLAVQTPDGWVLMDGGQGTLTGRQGDLLNALAEAGLKPEDIALIFISHCHADHYGGLVHDETGTLVFPNARYVTGATEWEHWTSPALLAEYQATAPDRYQALTERLMPIRPHLTLCRVGDEIWPGMIAVESPGHTPGHLSLLIENGSESLLYIGDAAVHPVHLKFPETVFFNDSLPEKSPATRRALIDLARAKSAKILACHFKFPGFFDLPADWPVEG